MLFDFIEIALTAGAILQTKSFSPQASRKENRDENFKQTSERKCVAKDY